MPVGYIYALLNESHKGLIKIGKSKEHPDRRAKQLSGTGVPHPYLVAYYEKVSDCDAAEKLVHSELNQFRESPKREFFRVSPRKAVKVIQRVAEEVNASIPFPTGKVESEQQQRPSVPVTCYGYSFSCEGCGNYKARGVEPFATKVKCPSCGHENNVNIDWSTVHRA